jgi:Nif11 domain
MTDKFDEFRSIVYEDRNLQRRLLAEAEVEPFLELLIAAAQERGFDFTSEEVREALQEARRSWFERYIR